MAVQTGNGEMKKAVPFGTMLSSRQLEEMLGIEAGSFSPIAWLVIQEFARGRTTKDIAESLGVSAEELDSLRDDTTHLEGEESIELWQKGVMTLQTVARLNQITVENTWDAVEAMAVGKLATELQNMKSNGDPMQMLTIAEKANKAIRRGRGEGHTGGVKIDVRPGSGDVTLRSGELGMIRLNLSPAVKEQLSRTTRVIDVSPNRPKVLANAKMLDLSETRKIGDSNLDGSFEQDSVVHAIFGTPNE